MFAQQRRGCFVSCLQGFLVNSIDFERRSIDRMAIRLKLKVLCQLVGDCCSDYLSANVDKGGLEKSQTWSGLRRRPGRPEPARALFG